MLDLASTSFYTHDRWGGYAVVIAVCGAMIVWCLYVAYTNFGPPAKRRAEAQNQQ